MSTMSKRMIKSLKAAGFSVEDSSWVADSLSPCMYKLTAFGRISEPEVSDEMDVKVKTKVTKTYEIDVSRELLISLLDRHLQLGMYIPKDAVVRIMTMDPGAKLLLGDVRKMQVRWEEESAEE